MPPLRDRPEDIGPLVRHFIRKHGGAAAPSITDPVVEQLARYSWPGNVRELENLVQRALVLSSGPELSLDDFRFNLAFDSEAPAADDPPPRAEEGTLSPREEVRQTEREELRKLLVLHGGNVARAARAVGIARSTLVSRAKKHRLLV
jgi:DNA-binding NtrC family response regulator